MTQPSPDRVWVRGTFVELDNQPMKGRVIFTPAVTVLTHPAANLFFDGKPWPVNLDENTGYFQIELIPTDLPELSPTRWTWTVSEPTGRRYRIRVPRDTPILNAPGNPLHGQRVLDLALAAPVPPSSGVVQLLSGPAGLALLARVDDHEARIAALEAAGSVEGVQGLIDTAVLAHVEDATPHPSYDEMPDLTSVYEMELT